MANGQAWVPQQGQGAVTLAYQRISNTGHRLDTGVDLTGDSVNMAAYLGIDYATTNRLSFSVGLPYVWGKYLDKEGPPGLPFLSWDKCNCWQSGPQDIGLTARYNLILARNGSFALTPSVFGLIPSNKYEFRGESVQGRRLWETGFAVDAGQRLDVINPNLSVLGHYSYAIVQRVLAIPNNRSNFSLEGRYQLFGGRFTMRGFTMWQRTHGGLRIPQDLIGADDETKRQHDRLLRDNSYHAGGGFAYSFPKVDVFGSYIAYVSGSNTHSGGALTLGVSWPFEFHRR
ncbi:MAG: hypothetical protein ABIR70_23395 [Bryobacteraceae bacterium]